MKSFHVYSLLIFLSLTIASTAAPKYAKKECKDMCGDTRIPYPFGIGAKCSINEWYHVDCYSSKPYLSALNNQEVLDINLTNQTVTINVLTTTDCQNPVRGSGQILSVDLDMSPFLFSGLHNIFVVEGCGNAVILDRGSALTGCSTLCGKNSVGGKNNCLGITCCHMTIPHYLKSYSVNHTSLERLGRDGACGTVFLMDKNSYLEGTSSRRAVAEDSSFVPISLLWTLSDGDTDKLDCCSTLSKLEVDLGNGTSVESWKCSYFQPLNGNPYIRDGCSDTEECARCKDSGGYCLYKRIYDVDGLVSNWNFTCVSDIPYDPKDPDRKSNKTFMGVIIGVSISVGVLFLIATSFVLYNLIKKTKDERQRKRFFKRNGGLLLKQKEKVDPSLFDKTLLFTSPELEKATDNFNENRIMGRGGQGTVYKGMLVDGSIVAIKKSKIVDASQLQQFINEVVILSQINHRNIVKLLGCCLETDVPLLVSEFIPNGTLFDFLHNATDESPIFSLNLRLQIATEVAGALAYLHSATSIPIYHKDIKTSNILLDDKYRAKVSDFGTSRFVSVDQTHLTTIVKGTFGYLDPSYLQSSQFTEKSDVYSFGVVLVELLTRERPISLTRFGEHRSLATHFMLAMEEDRVMSIFDTKVVIEGNKDDLLAVANLALRCLSLDGKSRPTMNEVAAELETIRMLHVPSSVQTKFEQVMYGADLLKLKHGESTSTCMSCDDSICQ